MSPGKLEPQRFVERVRTRTLIACIDDRTTGASRLQILDRSLHQGAPDAQPAIPIRDHKRHDLSLQPVRFINWAESCAHKPDDPLADQGDKSIVIRICQDSLQTGAHLHGRSGVPQLANQPVQGFRIGLSGKP